MHDLRYAFRQLFKAPAFTVAALLTIALGIAGATAIFSVIDAVLLDPLPYPQSDRIVSLSPTIRSFGTERSASAPANYLDWAAQQNVFSTMAAARGAQADLTDGDRPERVRVTTTTASLFTVFEVAPILGRVLSSSDEQPGRANVAVLSAELWARRFASDRNVLGQSLTLNGEPHTIIGVMPAHFSPDGYGELWVPSPFGIPSNSLRVKEDPRPVRDSNYLDVWARLKPGVTLEQARAEMAAIAARLEQQYPIDNRDTGVNVVPIHEQAVGQIRPVLLILFAAVGSLLLIGCANVANLLLARSASRAREIAIRAALGASRARLVRQLLTESVVLALLGGLLGAILAAWAIPLLLSISPPGISAFKSIGLNGSVLAFSLGASLLTGILFGLAPAIAASSAAPAVSLKRGERGGSVAHSRGRALLIMFEVGLSLVLLIAAGLMVKSFARVTQVDPGFRTERLLIFSMSASAQLPEEERAQFYRQALDRISAVPGIERVGATSRPPLSGGNSSRTFSLDGGEAEHAADVRVASADYFPALGIPLLRGRNFNPADTRTSEPVAVINEAAARAFFPGEEAIGHFITNYGPRSEKLRIVGVVGNVRHLALESAPRPEVYQPLGQAMWPSFFVTARTRTSNPLSHLPAVQEAVWSVNKAVPLGNPRTMEDFVARSLLQKKFVMTLLAIFAGLALLLAAIGLYGVISFSVAQRTRELGIRLALGAQRRDVLALVIREGMMLVALGLALGIFAALGLTRLLASLLYGISPTDPGTYAALALILAAVALLACLLPARRASTVDPIVALRAE